LLLFTGSESLRMSFLCPSTLKMYSRLYGGREGKGIEGAQHPC